MEQIPAPSSDPEQHYTKTEIIDAMENAGLTPETIGWMTLALESLDTLKASQEEKSGVPNIGTRRSHKAWEARHVPRSH